MTPYPAPNATFLKSDGSKVSLSELTGQKTIVLFFYPKDRTSGCTAEACSFRDSYEDFKTAGADVIGVSADDAASHEDFKGKYKLPFTLLTDSGGEAAKAMGIKKTLGLIPGRVTFVIDRKGQVVHRFESQLRATQHVDEALQVVKTLEKPSAA